MPSRRRPAHRPLAIVYQPLKGLKPYVRNARVHTPEQILQLRQLLGHYGWTTPMGIADGELIYGHGRLQAALAMAEAGEAIPGNPDPWSGPVVDLSHLAPADRQAYRLADNESAAKAGWDAELLRLEMLDLQALGFDLALTAFDDLQLGTLLEPGTEGLTDPDDAPDVPEVPVSRRGDVWTLGRHRLVCGDATQAADVALTLNGVRPHLMVTDPPYGVAYDADWRNSAQRANGQPFGGRAVGKVTNDDNVDWSAAWALTPADVAYVWHGALHVAEMQQQLHAKRFATRALIVWAKNNFAVSRGHYHWQHETCWYAVRDGRQAHWHGDRSQTTLWHIDKPMKSDTGHSTQKPVECMRRPIENNSTPGQAVYDPFVGSGTSIIAAEMIGRSCHAIEIAPQYVDVAVLRWQAFTGQEAMLGEQTFAEVKAARERPEVPEAAPITVRPKRKSRRVEPEAALI